MTELKEKSVNTWSTFKRLLKFANPYHIWLVVTIAASVFRGASTIFMAKGMKGIVDSAISHNMNSLINFLYLILIAFGLEISTTVIRTYSSGRFAEYSVSDMREKSEEHISNLPVSYLENHSTGDLISRLTNDLNNVKGFLENTLSELIASSIVCTAAIAYMFIINWKLALLTGIMVPTLTFIAAKTSKPIHNHTKKQQEAVGKAVSVLQDSIFGIKEIKSFVLEDFTHKKYVKNIDTSVIEGREMLYEKWLY